MGGGNLYTNGIVSPVPSDLTHPVLASGKWQVALQKTIIGLLFSAASVLLAIRAGTARRRSTATGSPVRETASANH